MPGEPELREATDAEKVARDAVTYPEWGTRLTIEQYLEREGVLRAHPFSRGMRTWLLVQAGAVLASCETYENASRVGDERGVSWSIASVYTEPDLRGRGHCTRLMDLLVRRAEREGLQACVLFSDVGERLYARSGYVAVRQPLDWVLDVPSEPSGRPSDSSTGVPPSAHGGPLPLVEQIPLPRLDAPVAGTLQLEPSLEQLDWALAREALYARFLKRCRPQVHTARRGSAHATWAAYFKSNELIILWLHPGTAEETAALLDAARAQAHQCGLERVRLWAPPGLTAPPAVSPEKRKDELPMWRALGPRRLTSWTHVQRALWV
jgi:GNAT superfamily N-acetyltransferase